MNVVKAMRLAKKLLKKDVLALSGGIISAHRLNMIEEDRGWRPRSFEKAILSQILDCPQHILFPEK